MNNSSVADMSETSAEGFITGGCLRARASKLAGVCLVGLSLGLFCSSCRKATGNLA